MKFSIKDFFSKYDEIRRKLQILSHFRSFHYTDSLEFNLKGKTLYHQISRVLVEALITL